MRRVSSFAWVVFVALYATSVRATATPPLPQLRSRQPMNNGRVDGPFTPPPCTTPVFTDVPCSDYFSTWINQLYADQVSTGCPYPSFCPDQYVTRAQMATFLERAMRGTTNWPPHTQLVWALKAADGTPDPMASGQALINAVAAIPTSGNDAPSQTNPWLLKVGAGVFNLGSAGLSLPAYVNLDGAGEESTTITAANDTWFTVFSSSSNTLSNATITNWGTGSYTYAIYASGAGLTLRNVFVEASGGSSTSVAILSNDSNLYIYDSSLVSSEGIYTVGGQYHSSQVWRTLFSNAYDIYNAAGQEIDLAYNRAPDTLANFTTGVFKCVGNYDFNLAPVSCP